MADGAWVREGAAMVARCLHLSSRRRPARKLAVKRSLPWEEPRDAQGSGARAPGSERRHGGRRVHLGVPAPLLGCGGVSPGARFAEPVRGVGSLHQR
jgi:hypothetical protein